MQLLYMVGGVSRIHNTVLGPGQKIYEFETDKLATKLHGRLWQTGWLLSVYAAEEYDDIPP